jgi:hydrogenase maturation factor
VSSANFTDFVVTTIFGDKLFPAQTACFNVQAGDKVIFTQSTGACASNSFADLRAGSFCKVWCQ